MKHGYAKSRLYIAWRNMKCRCNLPTTIEYARYGGRGITYTPEWEQFIPFMEWSLSHGYADNLTIDRIDNDGNYEPSNCRWVTHKENSHNRGNIKLKDHVPEIRRLLAEGHSQKALARKFNTYPSSIHKIKIGEWY